MPTLLHIDLLNGKNDWKYLHFFFYLSFNLIFFLRLKYWKMTPLSWLLVAGYITNSNNHSQTINNKQTAFHLKKKIQSIAMKTSIQQKN
jgi:hypothetical protein